jgi:hypothetical protein
MQNCQSSITVHLYKIKGDIETVLGEENIKNKRNSETKRLNYT